MKYTLTIVECITVEEADRTLHLGHSVCCSEGLARQLGTVVDPNEPQPWIPELDTSLDRPYGDEEAPPPSTEDAEILRIAGTAQQRGLLADEKLLLAYHDPGIPIEPVPPVVLPSGASDASPETSPTNLAFLVDCTSGEAVELAVIDIPAMDASCRAE